MTRTTIVQTAQKVERERADEGHDWNTRRIMEGLDWIGLGECEARDVFVVRARIEA